MNKIKIPLRVCLYSDQMFVKHLNLKDSNNMLIAKFENQQTAQLFADCFEAMYAIHESGCFDITLKTYLVTKRAAEAVEGLDMKDCIFDCVSDLVRDFMYYDRKEDEELPLGAIESSIKSGEITVDEIVDRFRCVLIKAVEW